MKLDELQRLQFLNQFETLKILTKTNNYDSIIEIIRSGYEGRYDDLLNFIDDKPISAEVSSFVEDILNMYKSIFYYKRDNPSDQDINKYYMCNFRGFDGNNESEYLSYTYFVLEEQKDRWEESEPLNSHDRMFTRYSNMLNVWKTYDNKYLLNKQEINSILEASRKI
jgi:hypothetical protein